MAATIIISICMAAVVGLIIWYMVRKNNKGKGGGCGWWIVPPVRCLRCAIRNDDKKGRY